MSTFISGIKDVYTRNNAPHIDYIVWVTSHQRTWMVAVGLSTASYRLKSDNVFVRGELLDHEAGMQGQKFCEDPRCDSVRRSKHRSIV